MQEKFDEWNEIKKQINSSQTLKYPSVGKIYWCSVGYNVGREVYGKGDRFRRPVLVLNVLPNKMFFGIPLSSQTKNKTGFMFYKFKDNQGREQVALLAQAKSYDIKRIMQYLGKVDKKDLRIIRERVFEKIIGGK
ncbi:type II toxin-antitoxin system PemK/MazF family toxin [uncultured Helicobacter sp.]|uniref:type II toxin-antitoxin system PemK/MazF family toxin n=1 Tax=uncultured Helicobacter sp. TaxID=175537 RepID=UPI0026137F10|nr:type II toxin-antitoxin system PemK/MazF family toxin [uncultured Helicobacter sp.]